jgi:glutamate dehydrogenase/leucine dehydrogenase
MADQHALSTEAVSFLSEPEEVFTVFHRGSRLRAAVAINSTVLGPALGGTRFRPYPTLDAAVADARNLAEAMTLKNAVAGVPFGGGKAVLIGDPATDKTPELLVDYAELLNTLRGRYITAEDVGMTMSDMDELRRHTAHVTGTSVETGGSGDPSPLTAVGVMSAMEAAAQHRFGTRALSGRHVSISGLGKVGSALARLLLGAGCRVTATDVSGSAAERLRDAGPIELVAPQDAHKVRCDIFAPCALGGVLNDQTLPQLGCEMVVGAANNQLASPVVADELRHREILYVPDFVANAGGVINIAHEHLGYDLERATAHVKEIFGTTTTVLDMAARAGSTPLSAAFALAKKRLDAA